MPLGSRLCAATFLSKPYEIAFFINDCTLHDEDLWILNHLFRRHRLKSVIHYFHLNTTEIKKDVMVRLMECDKCLLLLPSSGLVSIHQNELLFFSFRDENSFPLKSASWFIHPLPWNEMNDGSVPANAFHPIKKSSWSSLALNYHAVVDA